MKEYPLPVCTSAPNAEMGRNGDDDGPCDDGRGRAKSGSVGFIGLGKRRGGKSAPAVQAAAG